MLEKLAKTATTVSTPLALAGLVVVVFYGVFRGVLALDVFPMLTESHGYFILISALRYVFYLGLLSVILGVGAYIYGRRSSQHRRVVNQYHSGSGDNVAGDKL